MEKTMNLIDRLKASTPKIFQIIRNTGLGLAAAGGAILASTVVLPATIVTIGGYMVVAGAIMSAVSQVAVEGE